MEGQVDPVEPDLQTPEPDSPIDGSVGRASGFHVRVVPIDQPIGE
jgi:hypothetical protein